MLSDNTLLGIRGWLIDAPEYGRLRHWSDGALIINGRHIADAGPYDQVSKKPRTKPVRWLQFRNAAIFPGLIDLHAHIPQYPAVARGQSQLLPWLRQHIFPLERQFSGQRGRREAGAFFSELARHGTTTGMLYSAIYEDSCEAAFHAAAASRLRIMLGKTMMDVGSYGQLQPTKIMSVSLHESERLCQKWHGAADGLIEYAFSPRFAVSCTEKLMRGAAELAAKYGAYLQTHLAENLEENEKVRHQFPTAVDYTDVYTRCGLLTPRTILGHCIHLTEREHSALAEAGCAIAHCPTANFFLSSGIMPLDRLQCAGLRIGLGSDVGAGPELNLWQVMRSTIEAQKARSFYEPAVAVPGPAEALYLATLGGAAALGKSTLIGTLDPGKEADLTVMHYGALLPYQAQSSGLSGEDVLSLCIYRGGPHAVLETFVRGESVYRAPEPELF